MKTPTGKYRIMVIAAAAAVGLAAGSALAQQRVGNDGHALDANNRIGSGGYNTGSGPGAGVTPSDIVYGNVTGGREFRGPVGSTDPRAFRGPTVGTQMDRFVSGSAGAPPAYTPPSNPYTPQPFYGGARGVAPPPGSVQVGATGGYISAEMTPHRLRGDTRMGQVYQGVENYRLPQPGEMTLLGGAPAGSEADGILVTGSPLYGIRQWNAQNPADRQFLQNFTNIGQEMEFNAQQQAAGRASGANVETGRLLQPEQPANSRPEPLGQPLSPVRSQAEVSGERTGNQPLDNRVGAVARQGYQTLNAQEQNPQYRRMHQRLQEFYKQQHISDAQAQRLADQQMELRVKARQSNQNPSNPANSGQQGAPPAAPNQPGQGAKTGQDAEQGMGLPGYQQRMHDILKQKPEKEELPAGSVSSSAPVLPAPVRVESLAEGVESPDLAEHMKRAETLMRQGKFTSAIEQYKAAQKISPNNALVLIGRANAELGAGYFNPAATHLRLAYLSDPTVSMGQFDLKRLIGEERLTQVATDLKTIANKDLKTPAPVFLLAYIAYNTGSPETAGQWLDAAARRSSSKDPLFKLLRSHWTLVAPSSRPATSSTSTSTSTRSK